MTAVLVDSKVLLDVATNDPTWGNWSGEALARAADESILVVNALIYAEVSIGFSTIEELEAALPASLYRREDLPWEAAFLAGKSFLEYRRRGGTKHSPLPDFYIGAHAAVAGHRLLTRDATRYRTYFPSSTSSRHRIRQAGRRTGVRATRRSWAWPCHVDSPFS